MQFYLSRNRNMLINIGTLRHVTRTVVITLSENNYQSTVYPEGAFYKHTIAFLISYQSYVPGNGR